MADLPIAAVDAFAAVVCGFIAWYSLRYILDTIEYGDTVLIDVPAWTVQGILPVAFALMCYRFTLYFLKELLELFRRGDAGVRPE